MPNSTLISGPYGSERVPVLDATDPAARAGAANPESTRVPLNDLTVSRDAGFSQARAGREARLYQPEATMLESVGAAIMGWDTTRLIQRLGRPSFDGDTPINAFEYLQHVPMQLSDDEREYFVGVAQGEKSAKWALEQIQGRRTAGAAVGDHPIVGVAASFVDPLWLAVPPGVRLGKASPIAGRAVAAASAAALGGAVTAFGEGPVSDSDIALSLLMNGALGGLLYKGGKLVPADPEFPKEALDKSIAAATTAPPKPHYKLVDGVPVETPRILEPGALRSDAAEVVKAVDTALSTDAASRGVPNKFAWNMHKTMSSFGDVGRKVADLLYDNNSDLSLTSLESHREAILSELRTHQYSYETLLRQAMAEDGHGTVKMLNPFTSREAYAAQNRIEREVQRELFRREQMANQGAKGVLVPETIPPRIAKMADALDALHAQALDELKRSGVKGAADLEVKPGYMTRKWSSHAMDQAMDKMVAAGLTHEVAQSKLYGLASLAVRRANGLDKQLSDQIGKAIVDRTLRKGYFEDALFNSPAGEGQLKEMRDILRGGGMSHQDIERALDVLRVAQDDAGKVGFLKHRMDVDYRASIRVGDENISIMDLIDNRVSTIVDGYVQQASTQSAFARKGFGARSDIEALREELLHSVPVEKRGQAKDLFDNTIAHFRGDPAGARVNENFRLAQSYGRAISLAWSYLWQTTEFSTMMAQYGLGKTLKYAAQEIPGFKQMMSPTKSEARSLANVLADHSSASMRLRPYLAKFEDGFEMDTGSAMQLAAQTQGQLVPYANAMKYVHHFQAKVVGNLIVDRLEMAAKGNAKAREALGKYGLESHVMDNLSNEIKQHGMDVDAWSDKVWDSARPAFAKMMDEAVLRGRLGDVPAFAAFDQVGKFVFTYRTFVLTAHNKVLTGMAERNGAGAVGLVLMYQLPLALAAVQAQSVIKGDGPLEGDKLFAKAAGQMGGLGLLSEPLKWVTGESNSIGAPGLIPFDRGIKFGQSVLHGDFQAAGGNAASLLPVVAASPFLKAIEGQLKH